MHELGSIANLLLALIGVAVVIVILIYSIIAEKVDEIAFKANKKAQKKSVPRN